MYRTEYSLFLIDFRAVIIFSVKFWFQLSSINFSFHVCRQENNSVISVQIKCILELQSLTTRWNNCQLLFRAFILTVILGYYVNRNINTPWVCSGARYKTLQLFLIGSLSSTNYCSKRSKRLHTLIILYSLLWWGNLFKNWKNVFFRIFHTLCEVLQIPHTETDVIFT